MARPAALISALIPAVALGGAWWWAAARVVCAPEHAGVTEKVVVAGGWGLSLLPVHVTSRAALAAEAAERVRRRLERARRAGR
ncbi:hypothetical protein [Streptomyces fuscigenes]|uniref:hypothetical protein n=1 Tax=Streptomyces fuscigenes TaxID=1528880 RepID=UPI001F39BBD2|nr:hypothetical protein [Streptomyces fuscigenes]MCF3961177.1 hypothetical protein [Streptomyces fuscigenes]